MVDFAKYLKPTGKGSEFRWPEELTADRLRQPTNGFRYATEDWTKIVDQCFELTHLRSALEFMGGSYIRLARQLPPPTAYQQERAWKRVARAAHRLTAAIQDVEQLLDPFEALSFSNKDERASFKSCLSKLPSEARIASKSPSISELLPTSNNTDLKRDIYLAGLIRVWCNILCRALGSSRQPQSGAAGGPLIRFLQAASGPVFDAAGVQRLAPETMSSFIRKCRESLKA